MLRAAPTSSRRNMCMNLVQFRRRMLPMATVDATQTELEIVGRRELPLQRRNSTPTAVLLLPRPLLLRTRKTNEQARNHCASDLKPDTTFH